MDRRMENENDMTDWKENRKQPWGDWKRVIRRKEYGAAVRAAVEDMLWISSVAVGLQSGISTCVY